MKNGVTERQVNQKMALILAYDYLKSLPNDAENKGTFLYTVTGEKITLKDSLEAIKSCACAL